MIKKRIKKVTLLLLTAFMMVQLVGCAKSGYTSFEIANFDETKRKTEIQIPNDILMGDGKKALENSNNNTLEISLQKEGVSQGIHLLVDALDLDIFNTSAEKWHQGCMENVTDETKWMEGSTEELIDSMEENGIYTLMSETHFQHELVIKHLEKTYEMDGMVIYFSLSSGDDDVSFDDLNEMVKSIEVKVKAK